MPEPQNTIDKGWNLTVKTTLTLLILLTVFSLNTSAQHLSPIPIVLEEPGNTFARVWSSPDGSTLVSVGFDATLKLWDINTGKLINTLEGTFSTFFPSPKFSPDGSTLVSVGFDATLNLWDVNTGKLINTLEGAFPILFSPDGSTLVSVGFDATLKLWDINTGKLINTLEGHRDAVRILSLSPDGSTLISGSADNTLKLWDVNTGKLINTLEGHRDAVRILSLSPDGSTLISGSADNTLKLWDVNTGKLINTDLDKYDSVLWASFRPDGSLLVSGRLDNNSILDIYDVNTGKPITFDVSFPDNLTFSPDGNTLLSLSSTNIELWEVSTGNFLNAFRVVGYSNFNLHRVVSRPDGSFFAIGISRDFYTVALWEFPDTFVSITALPVDAPAIGDRLTLNINITEGENVTGYQTEVLFDPMTLHYVESSHGDFLPEDSFSVPPVVKQYASRNSVLLGATSLAKSSSGDGTLATLTFEFTAVKKSTVTLSQSRLINRAGEDLPHLLSLALVVGRPSLREDVNLDGVVNILDLTLVAASFGKQTREREDINGDGVVDIVDLVRVAGALGNAAAAPSAYPQALAMFTAADVEKWLSQARQLNLIDAASQRGILFFEQLLAVLTPKETTLLPNYPNPFNPETWIPYQLAKSANVTVTLYTVDGKLVRMLDLGHQPIGIYQSKSRAAYWDGRNALGEPVASGVYFYKLTAGDFTATRKMLIGK